MKTPSNPPPRQPRRTLRALTATALLVVSSLLASCGSVSETGRSQFLLFSDDYMNSAGLQAYAEITKEYKVITGTKEARMVEEVGQRIAKASGKNFQWEFKLLDAPQTVNAFCLPGGKIAIYTGILPLTQDADGLAAVMGHEVAHATASHGNERMSQSSIVKAGLMAGAVALDLSDADEDTKEYTMAALGMGAQVGVLLPYSREHESEADEIGLLYLIRAGYDPEAAPKLWDRMAKLGGDRGPAFLSTHPDPVARAARLRELIPVMKERVAKERAGGGSGGGHSH